LGSHILKKSSVKRVFENGQLRLYFVQKKRYKKADFGWEDSVIVRRAYAWKP
jgi:hypothetical protein